VRNGPHKQFVDTGDSFSAAAMTDLHCVALTALVVRHKLGAERALARIGIVDDDKVSLSNNEVSHILLAGSANPAQNDMPGVAFDFLGREHGSSASRKTGR
jgi:hypothetical protein